MTPILLALSLFAPAAEPSIPERDAILRRAAAVRPAAGNFRWQQIPWLTDPAEALETAKKENRPLLVWIAGGRGRDGTPLERCCGYAACLRAGPLNQQKVVRLVSENFVPVALNNNRIPDTEDGRFFKNLTALWSQGLWVVSPDGKVIAFHYHKNVPGTTWQQNEDLWLDGTVDMLEEAVKAAGPLTARTVKAANPFPDRGVGSTKDGGSRLAVGVIGLIRGKPEGAPAVDSVHLSKGEWAAFAPPAGQDQWTLPEAVGKAFAPTLSPLTDSIFVPRPDDVTTAAISGRVVRNADGLTVIRYTGRWESHHLRDNDPKLPIGASASGDGIGVYDPASKRMRSLVWVLRGTYRNGASALETASVVEWVAESGK